MSMTPRQERGLVIASIGKLNRCKDGWIVPSQSRIDRTYNVSPERQTCTCPDHMEAGHKCKHLFAVEYVIQRELFPDGTVTETRSVKFTARKTYKQNWPAYGKAQRTEKNRFQELLFELCQTLEEPVLEHRGRQPHSLRDSIFAMVFKVFSGFSSRRVACDLEDAFYRGFTSKLVPGAKTPKFFENPALTPILKQLIGRSALPLRAIETEFAIDSSGFATSKFERWFDEKWGKARERGLWIKTHIACGVKTNVVTAVRILEKHSPDSPQFAPLVKETAREFTIGEVSADKAYASLENFEAVAECGGTGYIAFKSNITGAKGGLFERMFFYFQFKKDQYMDHYHKRSNVESTFSMIKRKFGDSVRSKTETAMTNEVLCKILAHNLSVLVHEECELGIEAEFRVKPKSDQDILPLPIAN